MIQRNKDKEKIAKTLRVRLPCEKAQGHCKSNKNICSLDSKVELRWKLSNSSNYICIPILFICVTIKLLFCNTKSFHCKIELFYKWTAYVPSYLFKCYVFGCFYGVISTCDNQKKPHIKKTQFKKHKKCEVLCIWKM